MLRKGWFWILLTVASALATVVALRYFAAAFPLVEVDLRMSRQQALAASKEVAAKGVGPARFRQAASFVRDAEVQSFVELEAGGRDAFRRLVAGKLYAPYRWQVRHFREGEVGEATISFTPEGELFGFIETLPEDAPGAALDAEPARALAEQAAASWNVELAGWRLVEQGAETRPGGRVDHTLVYELDAERLGEGRYRRRLVVAGDRLVVLAPEVEVPEAFSRRFAEMRSDNDAIAAGAAVVMTVFYLLGGCIGGLVYLLRGRWLAWRAAVGWAIVVAGLQLAAGLAEWPAVWLGFDTALDLGTFAVRQVLLQCAAFVGNAMLLAVSFMVAESLGRRAFPQHLQLWRSWSPPVAASREVAGQTVVGYLLVGVFFAYEVGLYLFTTRTLGWWSPADNLVDPNVLASYLPWLSALAPSLQAGFWEECLFRAVPLAGGALLGERWLGRRGRWWGIAMAFVVQALVFGAGHANYPTEPAWARIVELVVPSFLFAGLYLLFGLLPAIVMHFAYDVVWFALPLFVASGSGIWLDRLLVVVLTLVPLLVVAVARWRAGRFIEAPAAARNGAWEGHELPVEQPPAAPEALLGVPPLARRLSLVAGLLGLVTWAVLRGPDSAAPPLGWDREPAVAAARDALAAAGFAGDAAAGWRELPAVQPAGGTAHRFVWQEGGREAYERVMGVYLAPPRWTVRMARFEGDVAERAEEWLALASPEVTRVRHQLPESRAGASLGEEAARAIAAATLRERYGIEPASLVAVAATPRKRPARTDWTFTWRDPDPARYPLVRGEARLEVEIAGDEVVGYGRFVKVPEEWERADRGRESLIGIMRVVCGVVLGLLFVSGLGVAVVAASRRELAGRAFLVATAGLAVVGGFGAWNQWPQLIARLDTAQPWQLQVGLAVVFLILAMVLRALGVGLLVGLVSHPTPAEGPTLALPLGLELGSAMAGLSALAGAIGPRLDPPLADVSAADSRLPLLAVALESVVLWVSLAAFLLYLVALAARLTSGHPRRRWLSIALPAVLAVAVAGLSMQSWPGLLVSGPLLAAAACLAYLGIVRRLPSVLPLATAVGLALPLLAAGAERAHPGALAGALLGAALMLVLGFLWTRHLAGAAPVSEVSG